MFVLEASVESCVSELQYQLENVGGPAMGTCFWLFGATLLEQGRSLLHYAIRPDDTVDVLYSTYKLCV